MGNVQVSHLWGFVEIRVTKYAVIFSVGRDNLTVLNIIRDGVLASPTDKIAHVRTLVAFRNKRIPALRSDLGPQGQQVVVKRLRREGNFDPMLGFKAWVVF